MAGLTALLGDTLQGKEGEVPTSALAGRLVGLYFSAHWCPPCRGFTPVLGDCYTKIKAGPKGEKLEIVFVSSDQNEGAFDGYYASMPFLALPFSDRAKKEALGSQFGIRGIPSLLFVDADSGEIKTKDGRSLVAQDPEGASFPWGLA